MVENLLTHHDYTLLSHFVRNKVTSQIYAWPLLETFFSEIFNRDGWLLQTILTEAYRLSEVTPADIDPKRMIESFQPLTRGQYPVFNKYP
ncbi:unnamed protein product, partial [Adineta steineri]